MGYKCVERIQNGKIPLAFNFAILAASLLFYLYIGIQLHSNCPKFNYWTMIYKQTCTINIH